MASNRGRFGGRSGANHQQMPGPGPGLQQRFKEMTAQEQLIQQKKKEFENKLIEEKRKQQEEVLNKLNAKTKKDTEKQTPFMRYFYYNFDIN